MDAYQQETLHLQWWMLWAQGVFALLQLGTLVFVGLSVKKAAQMVRVSQDDVGVQQEQVAAMREAMIAQGQPEVSLGFELFGHTVYLVLRNTGARPAHNVQVVMSPAYAPLLENSGPPAYLANGLSYLGPGMELASYHTVGPGLNAIYNGEYPQRFDVTIVYEDAATGRPLTREHRLDLGDFDRIVPRGEHTLRDTDHELEQLRRSVESASGAVCDALQASALMASVSAPDVVSACSGSAAPTRPIDDASECIDQLLVLLGHLSRADEWAGRDVRGWPASGLVRHIRQRLERAVAADNRRFRPDAYRLLVELVLASGAAEAGLAQNADSLWWGDHVARAARPALRVAMAARAVMDGKACAFPRVPEEPAKAK